MRVFLPLLVAFVLPLASLSAAPIPIDGYAAMVGERVITGSDVLEITRSLQERAATTLTGTALRDAQQKIYDKGLEKLIENNLILLAFQKLGATLPEAVVQERVDTLIRENFNGDRAELLRTLQESGQTETAWVDKLRDQITINYMIQDFVRSKIQISPMEIRARYEERLQDFTDEELVNIQMITFDIPVAATNRLEILKKAYRAEIDLKNGADFAEVAKQVSDDERAANGGKFGWLKSSALKPEIRAGIQGLKKNQLTPLIKTEERFYLIKLLGIREGSVRTIDQVQNELDQEIREEKFKVRYQRWIEQLKDVHHVHRFQNPSASNHRGR